MFMSGIDDGLVAAFGVRYGQTMVRIAGGIALLAVASCSWPASGWPSSGGAARAGWTSRCAR
jgi:hypothetical protein